MCRLHLFMVIKKCFSDHSSGICWFLLFIMFWLIISINVFSCWMKLLVSYGNLPLFQTSVINIGFGGVSLDSLNTFRHSTLAKPMYFMLLVQKNKSPLVGDLLNYPKRCVSCFLTLHLGLTLRSSSWEFSFLWYQLFHWLK